MKRMAVLIAAAALACTAGALGTSAAGYGRHGAAARPAQTCAFVDEDGDGLCDCRTGVCRYDADGDGVCDCRSTGCRYDADGDGVCDRTPCGGHRARRAAQ